MPDIKEVTKLFASLLNVRFTAGAVTTEDSVRYTFFHALLSSGFCKHTDIILEYPHPILARQMIDTLITARDGLRSIAVGFKYDRSIPSEWNLNMTNRAGAVFSDLFRLAHIPKEIAEIKYFFYVSDSNMANYFGNERNGYRSFFRLEGEIGFDVDTEWIQTRPKSFRDKLQCTPIACSVFGLLNQNLARQHYLRTYELKFGACAKGESDPQPASDN